MLRGANTFRDTAAVLRITRAGVAGTSIGQWLGGTFGAFVAALVSIPLAGAVRITLRELWHATAWTDAEDTSAASGEEKSGPG